MQKKIRKIIKKIISYSALLIPVHSRINKEEAREILENWSARPKGKCKANNTVDIKFDLQIIIPAYNAEKYIEQCLKSVLQQKHSYSVVVTVINDGSTDKTLNIIERVYSLKSMSRTKIELINQENKGFSGARNTGLKTIKGKYIAFLDSDDVLADGSIQCMLDAAHKNDIDIVQGDIYRFSGSNIHEINNINCTKDGEKKDNVQLSGYPCGKIYLYTVLKQFCFPEGYWYEDTPISFILFARKYSSLIINNIVYGYRQNPESITYTSIYKNKSIDSYWITEECLKEFPLFGLEYNQRAYEYLLKQSIMNAGRTRKQPRKIRKAEFVLTCELVEKYFKGYKTKERSMLNIEEALKKKQFVKFELIILGM